MKEQHSHGHGQHSEEKMILAHDAVKGYRPVFYVCITLGILYLAGVLWWTL
jgi:hypothetical protein